MFSPWMAKERINIYLYTDSASYVAGEFAPPEWSNGIAIYQKKLIVSHEQPEVSKLHSVLAHEMSHLLFEGYWAEKKQHPPVWLNEGLAMMEENPDVKRPENSDWYRAMLSLTDGHVIPLKQFFLINPTKDLATSEKDSVSYWYVQAYSIVYFLYRKHTRLQFRNFCSLLREGKTLQQALWKAYRYSSLEKFESEWQQWLVKPELRAKIKSKRRSASARPPVSKKKPKKRGLKNVGFSNFQFHRLIPEN
jgi:hypothetical protein